MAMHSDISQFSGGNAFARPAKKPAAKPAQPKEPVVYKKTDLEKLRMQELAAGSVRTLAGPEKPELKKVLKEAAQVKGAKDAAPALEPKVVTFLGLKIDVRPQAELLSVQYKRNYGLSKSHNLLVAKFAEFKMGALSAMLHILGVSAEELRALARDAHKESVAQNRANFTENEYTSEMLAVIGGTKKQVKTQKAVTGEIRSQLMKQAQNLGAADMYDKTALLEIRLEQAERVRGLFAEEKMHTDYRLCLFDSGINRHEKRQDILSRLYKVSGFLSKASQRVELHKRALLAVRGSFEAKAPEGRKV